MKHSTEPHPARLAVVGRLALLLLLASGLGGCSDRPAPPVAAAQKHEHQAPHGGTAIVLGNEQFHLELLVAPAGGLLQAYVLDAEMERFIRIPAASIEIRANVSGRQETLQLKPVANTATGETVGDTSQFEAMAPWLVGEVRFSGTIPEITVRGIRFADVAFRFPEGNER